MIFRLARHTSDFSVIKKFYIDILGLELLGEFKDHNGYDGIFIGKANADWHLEFTRSNGQIVHMADEDDLLIFYPETIIAYNEIVVRFKLHHISPILPKIHTGKRTGLRSAIRMGLEL